MDEENERKLFKLACKLSSMTFVLKGCCIYHEGKLTDTEDLTYFVETLHEMSNQLFDFF